MWIFKFTKTLLRRLDKHFGMTPLGYRKSKLGNKDSKRGNALSLRVSYDVDTVQLNLLNNEGRKRMNSEVKEMPEFNVAYVRKVGAYEKEYL